MLFFGTLLQLTAITMWSVVEASYPSQFHVYKVIMLLAKMFLPENAIFGKIMCTPDLIIYHTYIYTYRHIATHVFNHTDAHMHPHAHTHTHTHTQAHIIVQTQTHKHRQTQLSLYQKQMYIHTLRTHVYTCEPTHQHIDIQ